MNVPRSWALCTVLTFLLVASFSNSMSIKLVVAAVYFTGSIILLRQLAIRLILALCLLGCVTNGLAIIGNGGRMPVYNPNWVGMTENDSHHIMANSSTRFGMLCDRIYLAPLGMASIGDVFFFLCLVPFTVLLVSKVRETLQEAR